MKTTTEIRRRKPEGERMERGNTELALLRLLSVISVPLW
jgi:hypothetical protein